MDNQKDKRFEVEINLRKIENRHTSLRLTDMNIKMIRKPDGVKIEKYELEAYRKRSDNKITKLYIDLISDLKLMLGSRSRFEETFERIVVKNPDSFNINIGMKFERHNWSSLDTFRFDIILTYSENDIKKTCLFEGTYFSCPIDFHEITNKSNNLANNYKYGNNYNKFPPFKQKEEKKSILSKMKEKRHIIDVSEDIDNVASSLLTLDNDKRRKLQNDDDQEDDEPLVDTDDEQEEDQQEEVQQQEKVQQNDQDDDNFQVDNNVDDNKEESDDNKEESDEEFQKSKEKYDEYLNYIENNHHIIEQARVINKMIANNTAEINIREKEIINREKHIANYEKQIAEHKKTIEENNKIIAELKLNTKQQKKEYSTIMTNYTK